MTFMLEVQDLYLRFIKGVMLFILELVKFEKAKKDEKWVNAMKEELKMIKKMKLRS